MNYMKEVSEMLGVELEEEFIIAVDGEKSDRKYKLTKTGCCACNSNGEWYTTKAINHILSGIYEIVKVPILDEVEKRYLRNIINPWRSCVECIFKYGSEGYEYVVIKYDNKLVGRTDQYILLPAFEKGKMYKGMKFDKEYTLEELGL